MLAGIHKHLEVLRRVQRRFFPGSAERSLAAGQEPQDTRADTVDDFAAYLSEHYGCDRILDLGLGGVSTLMRPLAGPAGAAGGLPLDQRRFEVREHTPHDFERSPFKPPERASLRGSLVLCASAIERLTQPRHLLATVRDLLEDAPAAILTTRLRPLDAPDSQFKGAGRPRAWSLPGFRDLLESAGLEVLFHGLTSHHGAEPRRPGILSILRRRYQIPSMPAGFRVVALVGAYNEEDVIVPFLEHTIAQGVDVCLLDNWSTDATVERAARFLGRGVVAILKFPADGPTRTHELHSMLIRKAELAAQTEADWFLHLDPDEIRESPWPGITLREALYRVDREGFNAVDHTCVVFHPTGGPYRNHLPLQTQFSHFDFGAGAHKALSVQVKAWKRQPGLVDCASTGGHAVSFPGRRVYPFKFLLRHYPIRSQEQGERKVFRERLPRFSPALRQRGWHNHYDGLAPEHSFVRNPDTLLPFNPETFYEEYLVERLSGIGVRAAQGRIQPHE